jgi:hypothetical protein
MLADAAMVKRTELREHAANWERGQVRQTRAVPMLDR